MLVSPKHVKSSGMIRDQTKGKRMGIASTILNINICYSSETSLGGVKVLGNNNWMRFFCNIRNNQGRGKCNQPRAKAEADFETLIIPDITTIESFYTLCYGKYAKAIV